MVRNQLGWDRETLGKYLGLSAREVYYIELGRIPSEEVVRVLKRLERFEPLLTTTSALLCDLGRFGRRISTYLLRPFRHFWWRTTGQMVEDQLVLECCVRPDYSYPLKVINPFLKTFVKVYAGLSLLLTLVVVLLSLT